MSDVRYEPRKKMSWKQWLVVILIFLAGLVAFTPVVMKCSKKSTLTTSISNAKPIYLLLVEFDQDFGQFPSDQTAAADPELKDYHGEYSNDYLGQFIAGGYVESEEIFYAIGGSGVKKRPDNDFSTREKTLEAGECGFAYVKGMNTKDFHADSPILMTPMYGDGYRFNPDVHEGKAVVLRLNGSVRTLRIDKNHHAKIGVGQTLFQGGKKTVWGEKGFDASRLCYAKSPYKYEKPILKNSITWGVWGGLIFIGVILYSAWRKLARKKRARKISSMTSE